MTETNSINSQTFSSRMVAEYDVDIFREDMYAKVAASLAAKWPTRDENDFDYIARNTASLTKALVKQYEREFLNKER